MYINVVSHVTIRFVTSAFL